MQAGIARKKRSQVRMEHDLKLFLERRNLSCSEVEELLDNYVDGDMPSDVKARFERHTEKCEHCHSLVSDCLHLVHVAKSLAETPIPRDVSERLREALRARVGHQVAIPGAKLTLVKPVRES